MTKLQKKLLREMLRECREERKENLRQRNALSRSGIRSGESYEGHTEALLETQLALVRAEAHEATIENVIYQLEGLAREEAESARRDEEKKA